MQSAAPTISRSPRQAPGGAEVRPDSSAMATPSIAITTPSDLRAVSASLPSTAPTSIVSSGSVDSASAPRAAVVEYQGGVEQQRERGKEQHSQGCHRGPVPARRPAGALQHRHRQQQDKADAEPERADGKRIDRIHQITGGPDRSPAETARQNGRQNAPPLSHVLNPVPFELAQQGTGAVLIKEWNFLDQ